MIAPEFPEGSHVIVTALYLAPALGEPALDGIVIDHQWKEGRWLAKVSHLDEESEEGPGMWDNWYPVA